jgi:hypothetical protein
MSDSNHRVPVTPYKNRGGPGWVVAHELDPSARIIFVYVKVVAGGDEELFMADSHGQPTAPRQL